MSLTLGQMTDHVAEVTGAVDAASREAIARFLRRRYQMIWDAQLWDDSKVVIALATTVPEVILPSWVDRVLAVKTVGDDPRLLFPVEVGTLWQLCPRAYEEAGDPLVYSELPPVGVHTHPNGGKLVFTSSAGGDNVNVRVRGMFNGLVVDETVTLAGTSSVTSANYFDEVAVLSKPPTTGHVRVTTNHAQPYEVQVLLADETGRRHARLRLHRAFESALTLTVLAKRTALELAHANDTPNLTGCENLLIAYGVADMWERMRQVAKSQAKLNEAAALMSALVARDVLQKARVVQLVPETGVYA